MPKNTNKHMHSRNVFRTPPEYTDLAIKYADFRRVCKLQLNGKVCVNYKNEQALRALTQMLLLEYFQLRVQFAPGSLVPTLPLRLNYILWLEDLLQPLQVQSVNGMDIGCGSSCIYSLLAAKKNAWHMHALESNGENITFATENVINNQLQHLVGIFQQKDKNVIFADFLATLPAQQHSEFCLCNPPFYDSTLPDAFHRNTRNMQKRAPPHNCPTGHAEELACEGGEVQFVQRIIDESMQLQQRVSIFTSMLGHKSSLLKIQEILQKQQIENFCTTEFCQGKTTRWGIAWSFCSTIDLQNFSSP